MKNKKMLMIFVFLFVFFGMNKGVFADDDNSKYCYYMNDDVITGTNAVIRFVPTSNYEGMNYNITFYSFGQTQGVKEKEGNIDNFFKSGNNKKNLSKNLEINYYLPAKSKEVISNFMSAPCPKYVYYEASNNYFLGFWATNIFVSDNESELQTLARDTNNWIGGADHNHEGAYYASNYKNGQVITSKVFWAKFGDINSSGDIVPVKDCESLFGDPNDDESIGHLINTAMSYIRWAVPVLIIVFGTIDMFKAVISSNEDEMRKAQKSFMKRVIAGVVVFFVPIFVNLLMNIADDSLYNGTAWLRDACDWKFK